MTSISVKLTLKIEDQSAGETPAVAPLRDAEYNVDVELLRRPDQPRLSLLDGDQEILAIPLAGALVESPLATAIEQALRDGQAVSLTLEPDAS